MSIVLSSAKIVTPGKTSRKRIAADLGFRDH